MESQRLSSTTVFVLLLLVLLVVGSTSSAALPLVKQCLNQRDCESCIAIIGCGWCGDSLVGWCLPGDENQSNITAYYPNEPDLEECPEIWWDYFQCAYADQFTFAEEPYQYVDDTGVSSTVTSVETWYVQNYYDDDPNGTGSQVQFSWIAGVNTIVATQPDSLIIFSNTTIKSLEGNFSDVDPFDLVGNVTDSAVGFYIDLINLIDVLEYADAPQAGWTCPSYEDATDTCPLAPDSRSAIDFTSPTVALTYAPDYQRLTISVTYTTIATTESPSVPLILQLDLWNATHPSVQANPNVDVFEANLTLRLEQYIFPTPTTSMSLLFLTSSVFSEGDFLSQNPDNLTAMNVSEADPELLTMQLQPGWIENKGIYGPSEPKIRTIAFSFVQSKQLANAPSKKRAAQNLQVRGNVQLEEGIPRNFGTLLGGGKKRSKAAVIAGATCAGVVVIVIVVAAVLIFKFNLLKPKTVSVGSSGGGTL